MEPMLEASTTLEARSEPTVAARGAWKRPGWVSELGIYGRAAYEWRRATALFDPSGLDDLAAELPTIDRSVADQVREALQEQLRAQNDPEATAEFPGGPEGMGELVAATVGLEITPCLEQVFQPASPPGAPFENSTWPTARQRQLLDTRTWLDRPDLQVLRRDAAELAEAIDEHGLDPVVLLEEGLVSALIDPTALFPTEVRAVHQVLRQRLGRPVDLYLLFNE